MFHSFRAGMCEKTGLMDDDLAGYAPIPTTDSIGLSRKVSGIEWRQSVKWLLQMTAYPASFIDSINDPFLSAGRIEHRDRVI